MPPRSGAAAAPDHPRARHARHHRRTAFRHECALEQGRAGIQLHLHRASAALAQAKQLHDELESFYVPNMDFEKWQTMLDKTLESLKT